MKKSIITALFAILSVAAQAQQNVPSAQVDQQQIIQELTSKKNVYFQKYDIVAPETFSQRFSISIRARWCSLMSGPRGAVPVVQAIKPWNR